MRHVTLVVLVTGALLMSGCAASTKHIPSVEGFDQARYAGKWYEIIRLPHWFEEGLSHVTAEYTINPDGTIQVVNRGYDAESGEWEVARAKARLAGPEDRGELKVTFFWPFSGAYRIIELDHADYQYAVVTGDTMEYFWILSRSPVMEESLLDSLLDRARVWGFDLTQMIRVDQTSHVPEP